MRLSTHNLTRLVKKKYLVGFALSLSATSCATYYESAPISDSSERFIGASYSLPMLQFDITTTRQVKSCLPEVEFVMVSKVVQKYVADWYSGTGHKLYSLAYRVRRRIFRWTNLRGRAFGRPRK